MKKEVLEKGIHNLIKKYEIVSNEKVTGIDVMRIESAGFATELNRLGSVTVCSKK